MLHHVKHTLSYRVDLVNEEVNVIEKVPEEGQSLVEVGFDICGTDSKPEILVDQGKPRMHLNPTLSLQSLYHLYL
jgi:hypothetical protein